jgi:dihydrofolate reductase
VVSNTPLELSWQNSTQLKGDGADAVEKLKKEHDKTLVIFGSGALVRSLMRRELIDEYVLQIHPLVLGNGRRLFEGDSPFTKLQLVDSVSTRSGVIIATFRPGSER